MSNSASIAAAKKRRSQQPNTIMSSKINNNNQNNQNIQNIQNIQNVQNNENNEIYQSRGKITAAQLLMQHDKRLFNLEKKVNNNNNPIVNSDLLVSDNKLSNKIDNNIIEISDLHNKMNKIGNDVNGINELIKTMNAIIMSQSNELSKLKSDFYNYIYEVTNVDNEKCQEKKVDNEEDNEEDNQEDNLHNNRDMEKHVQFEIS